MSERLPELPPDAQPIDLRSLEHDMAVARLTPVFLPMSVYDAMLCVNGLLPLEAFAINTNQMNLCEDVQRLQRFLRRHVPFSTRIQEQFEANRRPLHLPPLPNLKHT